MRINTMRISRKHFYMFGGLSNPYLFRKMIGDSWTYWENFQ